MKRGRDLEEHIEELVIKQKVLFVCSNCELPWPEEYVIRCFCGAVICDECDDRRVMCNNCKEIYCDDHRKCPDCKMELE